MICHVFSPILLIADQKKFPTEIYLWLGLIVLLAIALGYIALGLRKRFTADHEQTPFGFTLKDLRTMHEAGQLSDEEFAAAEQKALARSRSHYLGLAADPPEEPEDIGHLSTGSEDDGQAGTENNAPAPDKNTGLSPGP